jgi:hemoglobin
MKKDIEDVEDIKLLVNSFYVKVKGDETIGYIFNDIAKVNWEAHLPRMYSFWETILLGKISFKGNPIIKHIELNERVQLTKEHFSQWLHLWHQTVDELFSGKIAEAAKNKAETIKDIMLAKLNNSNLSVY